MYSFKNAFLECKSKTSVRLAFSLHPSLACLYPRGEKARKMIAYRLAGLAKNGELSTTTLRPLTNVGNPVRVGENSITRGKIIGDGEKRKKFSSDIHS